ncbi:MAG: hypothetical protein M3Y57_16845 [Acidobacteriota bacterium]|nr:hypothetical protein [Acidobacteriota bacterium]
MERAAEEPLVAQPQAILAAAAAGARLDRIVPQCSCPSCAGAGNAAESPSWIYAIGKIEARFPNLAIEKEYMQVLGRTETSSLTDRQALHAVLSKPENRYLARRVCWVMTIEGLETYLLYPRDSADMTLLIEAVRENPEPGDLDVVIGSKGPIAPPSLCNGLQLPVVAFDQVYSLDRDTLIQAIPKPGETAKEEFSRTAAELFDRLMQMADNAGATDEHRALNYLAVRYPAVYSTTSDAFTRNLSLESIDVHQSPLSTTRNIVEVVFSFRNRVTDVAEKFFTRVDVSDQFPFLVTKMSPYFDR